MHQVQLAPSVLAADFGRLAEEAAAVEEAGADLLHVDVMDGRFVPNLTLGPAIVAALRKATRLPLDVHLMIMDPDRFLEAFRDAGADVLTVHWEAALHLERTLGHIHDLECLAGVAVNPATRVDVVSEILDELDELLIMSVNPGFGGQKFWAQAIHKVEQAHRLRGDRVRPRIAVDGGVGMANAGQLARAGADILVAGTQVFGQPDRALALRELRHAVTPDGGPP